MGRANRVMISGRKSCSHGPFSSGSQGLGNGPSCQTSGPQRRGVIALLRQSSADLQSFPWRPSLCFSSGCCHEACHQQAKDDHSGSLKTTLFHLRLHVKNDPNMIPSLVTRCCNAEQGEWRSWVGQQHSCCTPRSASFKRLIVWTAVVASISESLFGGHFGSRVSSVDDMFRPTHH